MKLNSYQNDTQKTAIYKDVLTYPTLGLAGEAAELVEKLGDMEPFEEIAKEIGDVLYYTARVAYDSGLELKMCVGSVSDDSVWPETFYEMLDEGDFVDDIDTELMLTTGKICEIVKKTIRDHHCDLTNDRREKICILLGHIVYLLSDLAIECGTTLEIIAQENLDKLTSRLERGVLKGDGDNR